VCSHRDVHHLVAFGDLHLGSDRAARIAADDEIDVRLFDEVHELISGFGRFTLVVPDDQFYLSTQESTVLVYLRDTLSIAIEDVLPSLSEGAALGYRGPDLDRFARGTTSVAAVAVAAIPVAVAAVSVPIAFSVVGEKARTTGK
jgi:hypothetical protein